MDATKIALGFLIVAVLLSGCVGAPQDTGPQPDNQTDTDGQNDTTQSEASYNQTPHIGCQPGAIAKNGTCTVAFSGQNAEIFSATNLTPITAEETAMGGTPGYLARPADNGTYPGVIMIHEWWGLNRNIKHMADVLAGHGYTVFAVDLYDGEVAMNRSRAKQLSKQVRNNPDVAVTKMRQATDALRSSPYTTGQVASLGWCFGGGQSLQLSLSDADLNATVIYYGTLTTNRSTLQAIDAPVLGIFGSEDQVVGIDNVRAFNRTLADLGVEKEINVYEGASHAFANPSGKSFRPNATKDAWQKTLRFLDENLKDG